MNDHAQWQEQNGRFLAAALAWLRLRLQRQAQRTGFSSPAPAAAELNPAPVAEPRADDSWLNRMLGRRPDAASAPLPFALLPPASETVTDEQIAEAAQAMEAAAQIEPPPALHILAQRFEMSRFERDVLWLCAALELDTSIAALCNLAQGNGGRMSPTFALGLALFDEPVWEALSPERPLRYWHLLEINQPGAQPLTASALRADERIVNFIKGLNYPDDRLAALLAPLPTSLPHAAQPLSLPASQREAVAAIAQQLEQTKRTQPLPLVQLLGSDAASKHLVAAQVAQALGLHPYRLPVEWLPGNPAELETFARLLNRESILTPIAFYLDAADGKEPSAEQQHAATLHRFLNRANGLFFLDTRDVAAGLGRTALAFDIQKPTPLEQRAAWEQALGESVPGSPALLAGQFNLSLAEIQQVAGSAQTAALNEQRTTHERLWDGCLALTRPRLDALAQRLDAKAKWEDLVLPPAELALLKQIAAQVRQRARVYGDWGFAEKMNRGLGINALFAGDSGTGKTMAAEVIANDLRLHLYRIDLSAVVSKYIGETEKNLRKLFDAAEDGGALLFFDEADALFGKRSEVKDSHDRYANIEINYLLQRIEAYRGLALLATNMKTALDLAFMRRLRFIVNFPFPGLAERREMWKKVFPPQTQTAALDFDRLARLNLTGGNIHNVALNAAFLAAQADKPVTMPFLFTAARAEFAKLERPVSEADFYWQEPAERFARNTLREAA